MYNTLFASLVGKEEECDNWCGICLTAISGDIIMHSMYFFHLILSKLHDVFTDTPILSSCGIFLASSSFFLADPYAQIKFNICRQSAARPPYRRGSVVCVSCLFPVCFGV